MRMSRRRSFIVSLLLASHFAVTLRAENWPQWRGPDGQGHASATGLPLNWGESSNVVWKAAIPGRGWSSPVAEGGTLWLTTAVETAASAEDAARRLKANTGDQPLTLLDKVDLRAVGVDLKTGKVKGDFPLLTVREPQWVHKLNSYASPSPVLEKGRLYAHFGALGTACLDVRSGRVLWTNRELVVMHENGPGSTPVLWQDRLIFHLDGSDAQYVAALDTKTGKLAWKTTRSGEMRSNPQQRKSYGTPLIVKVNGREQLMSPGSDWVYGYDPRTGRELWKLPYGQLGFSVVPRPVAGHGMLFMSTGYGRKQMLGIQLDGVETPGIKWRYNKGVPTMPSPLLAGGELCFVDEGGFVTCLDALSGVEVYRDRLEGNFSASPMLADGRIYVSNREGATFVLQPGRQFKVLAKNTLPGSIMASPVAVEGALFLRTEEALYRIEDPGAR